MKTNLTLLIFIAATLFSCKKDTAVDNVKPALEASNSSTIIMAASGVPVNSVLTIAGSPYTSGPTLVNANGKNARFSNPFGIQLADDGTIYVADTDNDIIRVVSPAGDVSSYGVPDKNKVIWPSQATYKPKYVYIDPYGVVYIIDVDIDLPGNPTQLLVFNPNSHVLLGYDDFGGPTTCRELIKDPYSSTVWTFVGKQIYNVFARKTMPLNRKYELTFTNTFLPDDIPYWMETFSVIFPAYNGVIYFIYKGKLYKHTKDDIGAAIFPDLTFNNPTCMIVNKDGKTIYIADGGVIKRIDNGKVSVIVGPNSSFTDSRDGVGSKADVSAQYMALSKDESTIFFSDSRANAIRKIVLR